MGQQTIPVLKDKFADGKTPTGGDFGDVFDSYFHKSTKINQSQILGLNDALNDKASKEDVAIGLINKGSKNKVSDLPANAERGDAYFVVERGFIWQYDGTQWNETVFTKFPDNIPVANTLSNYPLTLESARKYAELTKCVIDLIITKAPENTHTLYIERFRKQNGVFNLFQIDAVGYVNSVGTAMVMGLGDKVEINGLTYYKLNSYANSGYEGYLCFDENAIGDVFNYSLEAYLSPEVYNESYPSLFRTLQIENDYTSKTFLFDRENDTIMQDTLLKDNPLHNYFTSDRCIKDIQSDVNYNLTAIDKEQLKTELSAKNNFPLPFDNIAKLSATVGAINRTHFLKTAIQRKGNFAVSYWFSSQTDNVSAVQDGTNRSLKLNWIKGINNRVVKSIDAGFVVVTIANDINTKGYYEKETADYILRCNAFFQYGKRTFYNLTVQTKGVANDLVFDNIEIAIGSGGSFSQNSTTTVYYTGAELLDKQQTYTSNNFREYLKGYAPLHSLVNESSLKAKQLSDYTYTHSEHNQIIDLLDNARVFSWVFDGGWRANTGAIQLFEGESIEKVTDPKFGIGYKIKSDSLLPVYGEGGNYNKMLLRYQKANDVFLENFEKEIFGFWIDRRELKGNSLCFTSNTGGTWTLRQGDLATVGYVETRVQTDTEPYRKEVEVIAVDGDYSFVVVRSLADNNAGHWLFNIILVGNKNLIDPDGEGVKELTLYRPTSLYNCDDIDPYFTYLSESQKNNSPLRGKTVMVMGDSQQNDNAIGLGIARRLGVNIIHAPLGGHRIKYQSNGVGTYGGWMYHWEARKRIFSQKADYYYLQISSNDSSGGGDSSTVATKAVIDNYPVWGDDETTINNKLALFNSLSEAQKQSIFNYKQTFSAFIKQICQTYPEAKVILATIPISSYQTTNNGEWIAPNNADTERDAKNSIFLSIRKDIFELSEKHSANVCDLFLKGGITWENFPTKVGSDDSVHWTTEAKKQFINPIVQSLLE